MLKAHMAAYICILETIILILTQKKELNLGHLEDKNIEIVYTAKITAAGSIRADGSRYVLRGMLQNAPNMTNGLINGILKPLSKRPTRTDVSASIHTQKQQYPQREQWTQGKIVKWNDIP